MQKSAYYRTNLIEYFNASEQERYLIINILNINKNSSLTWFNIKICGIHTDPFNNFMLK